MHFDAERFCKGVENKQYNKSKAHIKNDHDLNSSHSMYTCNLTLPKEVLDEQRQEKKNREMNYHFSS
ncbi:hypothetical protein [Oceanobacillus sp. FSL W7-1304]|uniref:hypothetical protein n=1 Tax=Oceanobacillus sp. FSL W7-1304 TaxID=2975322 RepID=UPI0030D7F891